MDRTLVTERRRVAQQVDVELCVAARAEAAARRELGTVAHVLLRRRAYRRLGFVRLSDYARERLGVSARTLQAAAWVATRLDRLPAIGAAFDRSDLSWTQARALCAVASAADESHWLELASRHSVDALERFVRAVRPTNGAAADHDADPDTESNEHLVDGEPALRLRFSCPARIRGLWRWAVELASRAAGEPLSEWRAAEIIAAEGFSGRPDGAVMGERALAACIRLSRRAGRSASEIPVPGRADGPQSPPFAADSAPAPRGDCDPFALDARLVDTMRVIRTSEPRIGHLLGVVVSHRFYRTLGFSSLESYVRERLGISIRKAWALLKLEKVTRRGPAFARAYSAGELSWARALALLPVLHHENAEAWVRRAQLITVRRLCDEVNAVLQARDMLGTGVSLDPRHSTRRSRHSQRSRSTSTRTVRHLRP